MIFQQLERLVVETAGADAWEDLLDSTDLQTSSGVFVGAKTYPDADLMGLVGSLSEMTGKPPEALVRAFGEFLFPPLLDITKDFLGEVGSARELLMQVDRVIHVEVRKVHPDAVLPEFNYEKLDVPNELVMLYKSERKLCDLAAGLIDGCAKHFGGTVTQAHPVCMKTGDDHCRFELAFS